MLENKIEELTREIRNLIIVMQKNDEAIDSLDKPAKTTPAKTTPAKTTPVNGPDVMDEIRANQKLALTVKDVTEQAEWH